MNGMNLSKMSKGRMVEGSGGLLFLWHVIAHCCCVAYGTVWVGGEGGKGVRTETLGGTCQLTFCGAWARGAKVVMVGYEIEVCLVILQSYDWPAWGCATASDRADHVLHAWLQYFDLILTIW